MVSSSHTADDTLDYRVVLGGLLATDWGLVVLKLVAMPDVDRQPMQPDPGIVELGTSFLINLTSSLVAGDTGGLEGSIRKLNDSSTQFQRMWDFYDLSDFELTEADLESAEGLGVAKMSLLASVIHDALCALDRADDAFISTFIVAADRLDGMAWDLLSGDIHRISDELGEMGKDNPAHGGLLAQWRAGLAALNQQPHAG